MKYIIANWKMNMDKNNLKDWMKNFKWSSNSEIGEEGESSKDTKKTVIFAPSFIHIPIVSVFIEEERKEDEKKNANEENKQKDGEEENILELASQDVSFNTKGAHTGSVGGFQIKDFCKYVIVGHSELNEDTETVIKKRDICLDESIIPIVCFSNPSDIFKLNKSGCIFAWEDPTNISKEGIYNEKDPQEIENVIKEIKTQIPQCVLIYGGSVNEQNIKKIADIKELDGVLVGNASLDPNIFLKIINTY